MALLASIRPTELQRVVNKQNILGRSPLQVAAKNGHLQCVLLLLQNQVQSYIKDLVQVIIKLFPGSSRRFRQRWNVGFTFGV